jgi:hypothetical protein
MRLGYRSGTDTELDAALEHLAPVMRLGMREDCQLRAFADVADGLREQVGVTDADYVWGGCRECSVPATSQLECHRRQSTKNPAVSGVSCVSSDAVGSLRSIRWCPGEDSNLHEVAPAST